MKKVFLSSLFLLATTPMLLAGVDPAAQQLLIAAEQQADLFNHDVGPFRLEKPATPRTMSSLQKYGKMY